MLPLPRHLTLNPSVRVCVHLLRYRVPELQGQLQEARAEKDAVQKLADELQVKQSAAEEEDYKVRGLLGADTAKMYIVAQRRCMKKVRIKNRRLKKGISENIYIYFFTVKNYVPIAIVPNAFLAAHLLYHVPFFSYNTCCIVLQFFLFLSYSTGCT